MDKTIAELYRESGSLEEFRNSVEALDGSFSFEFDDIMELGKEYLEQYPDTHENYDSELVQLGYRIARVCIIEQVIRDIDKERRNGFRVIAHDIKKISDVIVDFRKNYDQETLKKDCKIFNENVDRIKEVINTLPQGTIKERFTGGVSIFYNISYLIKMNIDKQ